MGRPRTTCLRAVYDAIPYIAATCCQGRSLPDGFPPFSTVQNHVHCWRDNGLLATIIDSRSAKTTQGGGPGGYDGGQKIKGRKRHRGVDARGTPVVMQVHAADIQDRDGAVPLVLALLAVAPRLVRIHADAAYSGAPGYLAIGQRVEVQRKGEG